MEILYIEKLLYEPVVNTFGLHSFVAYLPIARHTLTKQTKRNDQKKVVNDFGSLWIVWAELTFFNNKLYYIASLIKN